MACTGRGPSPMMMMRCLKSSATRAACSADRISTMACPVDLPVTSSKSRLTFGRMSERGWPAQGRTVCQVLSLSQRQCYRSKSSLYSCRQMYAKSSIRSCVRPKKRRMHCLLLNIALSQAVQQCGELLTPSKACRHVGGAGPLAD